MCGIFGIFSRHNLTDDNIDRCRKSIHELTHRGPDAEGEFVDQEAGIYFGHRRLKIVDLSEQSSQPMRRADTVLTYNGEIYNFPDIKARLEGMGHSFKSTGDTEVLLEAWLRWGPDCLDHMDGMFAFAILDGTHGWLAVDPFSEKQLYFAETEEGIVFSSELQVLADHIQANVDLQSVLTEYLSLGYISAPNTAYPQIKRLEPGTRIKIKQGRILEKYRYWKPLAPANQNEVRPKLGKQQVDTIHEILVGNIASRLISDVPLCLFLSSGVDSALVAAITKHELGRDLEAITVGFPQGDVKDESQDAARLAKKLGLQHRILASAGTGHAGSPTEINSLFGQPNANFTVTSVRQMAEAAQNCGIRVGLTGLGGDEIFFGYEKQDFAYRNRAFYNLPEIVRRSLGLISSPCSGIFHSARTFNSYFAVKDSERIPALKMPWMIDVIRRIPGFQAWSEERFAKNNYPFEFDVSAVDMMDTMVNSQLPALDIGSMRESVEFRTPFLSRKLCDFVGEHDWGDVMSHGRKWVLKELLDRYLPKGFMGSKKFGFSFPADDFLARFDTPPDDFPFLPQELKNQIWTNRQTPAWRTLAIRMMLADKFFAEMKQAGRNSS
jgi:asparagine synthase (glutamine-hydrolysing)